MANIQQLEQYLSNPRVRIFLQALADGEGTLRKGYNPYAIYGGNVKNQAQNWDPNSFFQRWDFKDQTGKRGVATASGKYQMLRSTWDGQAKKYGMQDFSPRNQDLAAVGLLVENGALPHILNGDWVNAVNKASRTWASLSPNVYNQATRTGQETEAFMNAYAKQIGYNEPISLNGVANYSALPTRKSNLTAFQNGTAYTGFDDGQQTAMQPKAQEDPSRPRYNPQVSYQATRSNPLEAIFGAGSYFDNYKRAMEQYNRSKNPI